MSTNQRKHSLRRSAAGSLLLHAALLGAIYWLVRDRLAATPVPSSRLSGPVSVDLFKGTGPKAPHTQGKAGAPKTAPPKQPLQLGPSFGIGEKGLPHTDHSGSDSSSGGGGQGGPADGYEVANSMGIEEESKLYPFFSALWRRIDTATGYPEDFVKERITGYVTAQLVIDRRGVFTGRIARVDSDQPLLETYVLAVLFHALSEPLPRELWSDREQVILVSRFEFHTFTYGHIPPPRVQKELKNVLEFERNGYNDPKVNEAIEKFLTHYMPPIIPVPGGFIIDFFRAYQFIQNLRDAGKMGAEDLRLERIDLNREQWEGLIRKVPDGQ